MKGIRHKKEKKKPKGFGKARKAANLLHRKMVIAAMLGGDPKKVLEENKK